MNGRETPTQEVETWAVYRCGRCGAIGSRESLKAPLFSCIEREERGMRTRQHDQLAPLEVIAFEDHQRLLRAVEEERDERLNEKLDGADVGGQFGGFLDNLHHSTADELDVLIEALDQHHPGSVLGCPGCKLMARLRQIREAANG